MCVSSLCLCAGCPDVSVHWSVISCGGATGYYTAHLIVPVSIRARYRIF